MVQPHYNRMKYLEFMQKHAISLGKLLNNEDDMDSVSSRGDEKIDDTLRKRVEMRKKQKEPPAR